MSSLVKAAWQYRGFVASSIASDFKTRLARSRFGAAWIIVQPLAQVLIFATILSNVLASRLEGIENKYAYTLYLAAGTVCWSLFAEVVNRCTTVFIDSGGLLKKIQFPRITLPLIVIGVALVNNLALMAVVLLVAPLLGFEMSLNLLWLPVLTVLTTALAAGLGMLLGTFNVFSRDVGQVVGIVLQFWFWATPVVYPAKILPDYFLGILALNPMAPLVASYQNVLLYGMPPETGLAKVVIIAIVLLSAAMIVFRRASAEMVDVL